MVGMPSTADSAGAGEPNGILVLTEREIRGLVALVPEALVAIERAFTSLAEGRADVPPIIGVKVPERHGEVDIKGAYVHGQPSLAVKIASGFYENAALGLQSGSGLMVVISARTGRPQAVLLDNGYLTDIRTALAGAAAARALAPADVRTLGIIGAGTQGRFQAKALQIVRRFERVLVHDCSREAADAYRREASELLGVPVAFADPRTLVRESDVVVTCTPSRTPVVRSEWLHPGLHITAIGADTADKQELACEVLGRADRLACDLKVQCFARGEYYHARRAGIVDETSDITELGEFTSGRRPGRARPEDITVCALTGVGVQDAAIALFTYARAIERAVGAWFDA